jgi:hypothetical protein
MKGPQYTGNIRQAPRWAGDFLGSDALERFPARIDPAQFTDQGGIPVVVAAGGAAAGATSIPINALTLSAFAATTVISANNVVIPAGSILYFGAAGSKKFAKVTADAKLGDTTLTVEALPTAVAAGDTANYSWWNGEFINSGVLVGRSQAMISSGLPFRPADVVTPDFEIYLVAFDVPNAKIDQDVALIRPDRGFIVKENYLPGFGTAGVGYGTSAAPTASLTWVRAHHKAILGQD